MRQRVLEFTSTLPGRHANEAVMIVAHGGVNRIILACALGLYEGMLGVLFTAVVVGLY
jgi:broad specificity phosphatase PhoE